MSPPIRGLLIALTLFLVLAPLAAERPGMPPTLKADEPAYYLMARSLAEDGDLRCDAGDLERLVNAYPYLPTENLILMSPDGWRTAFFGKPYLLSLLAAPLVALVGANGFVSLNAALLAAMIAMGTVYLRRFNPDAVALLFSTLFFVLSPAFAYVFWLHPEILNLFAATACLFLAFVPGERAPRLTRLGRWCAALTSEALRPAWSGAALALGVYNKPNIAALALPALYLVWRRRGVRGVAAWIAGLGVTLALLGGLATLLTGKPSAYLGMARAGVKIETVDSLEEELVRLRVVQGERGGTANSWTWILRPPDFDARELAENALYFLVGRHTGLVPYMPLAVLALALFLLHTPRSLARWLVIAGLGALAIHFLVWIPINWHGGGGFVGNRYFVMAYPAFLFLVTAVRPRWTLWLGAAAASLLLGSILLAPYGAPVPSPTLQHHARSPVFQIFPMEFTIRSRIPGYVYHSFGKVGFMGRKDLFKSQDPAVGSMWIQGGTPVEVWISSPRPLGEMLFEVKTPVPDNRVVLELGGRRTELVFEAADRDRLRRRTIGLDPGAPSRRSWAKPVRFRPGRWLYIYDLRLETSAGRNFEHPSGTIINPRFYQGIELVYLGTREQNERVEHYRVEWARAEVPERVPAGVEFEVPVRLFNRSQSAWQPEGPMPVRLSYRWLDATGRSLGSDGRRTPLAAAVAPDELLETVVRVEAPPAPGRYALSLDLVREHVAWFSRRGGATWEATVEVTAPGDAPAPGATGDTPGP